MIDHSILSPSGYVSKRTKKQTLERVRENLFGNGLESPRVQQQTEAEYLKHRIALLRDLAARGLGTRKYKKLADRIQKQLGEIEKNPA
jgi:hypothetical protein